MWFVERCRVWDRTSLASLEDTVFRRTFLPRRVCWNFRMIICVWAYSASADIMTTIMQVSQWIVELQGLRVESVLETPRGYTQIKQYVDGRQYYSHTRKDIRVRDRPSSTFLDESVKLLVLFLDLRHASASSSQRQCSKYTMKMIKPNRSTLKFRL